ncbi:MAG: hypothetical protein HY961_19300 [Ignavibacteriae bacterium]|nr:hypothetical protein [Ignavibacteriota bacterium]
MKTTSVRVALVGCFLFTAMQSAIAGGERTNVRGVGMGRTFVASSKGLDAIGINPANLAIKDDNVTISLVPVGVHAGSDFFTYGLYNKYFTGVETEAGRVATYLDDAAKKEILDMFDGGVGSVSADVSARLFGLSLQFESIGGFAFTITDQISAVAHVPKQYVEFALYGNQPNSVYDFSATGAEASWLREYALSFGGTIPHPGFLDWTSLGASIKIVQGFGYFRFGDFNTTLQTGEDGTLTGHVSYQSTFAGKDPNNGFSIGVFGMPVAGQGTGFDLGLAGGTTSGLTFGISITDIGKVNWEQNIELRSADTSLVVDDPQQVSDGDAIRHAMEGKTKKGEEFSTNLPTTLRFGVAMQVEKFVDWVPGELVFGLDFNQGLVDGPGSTTKGRISTGIEWKLLKFLPIRSGVSFGGTDRMNYAFGFGINLGFFDLDFASENMELLWAPDKFSHGSVAVGTRFRF